MICIEPTYATLDAEPSFFRGVKRHPFPGDPYRTFHNDSVDQQHDIAWPHSQDELHPRECRCVLFLSPPRPNSSKPPQKNTAHGPNGIDAAAIAGTHYSWGVNLPFLAFSRRPHFTLAAGKYGQGTMSISSTRARQRYNESCGETVLETILTTPHLGQSRAF